MVPSMPAAMTGIQRCCSVQRVLAEEERLRRTVRFIFQPAEEWGRGALAMLKDGLMERFPFEEAYGLQHARPACSAMSRHRASAIMAAGFRDQTRRQEVAIRLVTNGEHEKRLFCACALVIDC